MLSAPDPRRRLLPDDEEGVLADVVVVLGLVLLAELVLVFVDERGGEVAEVLARIARVAFRGVEIVHAWAAARFLPTG